MRLYHGSKDGIKGVIAPVGRSCCDFGRGFYLGGEPSFFERFADGNLPCS